MSALSIQPTYPIFTDIDGQPLEDGFVWIGQANLDPQVNPINVFWDAALTIPAGQPIRTLGGYPSNSGTPARLYVNSDYSIRVMNKNGSAVYSASAATERFSGAVISGGISAESVGFSHSTSYSQGTAGLALQFAVNPLNAPYNADPTGATDSAAAIQAALDAGLGDVILPHGLFKIDTPLEMNDNQALIGLGGRLTTSNLSFANCINVDGKTNVRIVGVEIVGPAGGNGFDNAISIFNASSNVIVENCLIQDIGNEAVSPNEWGGGISIDGASSNIKIVDNTIKNIKGFGQFRGDGITVRSSFNTLIQGNTIDTNRRMQIAVIDNAIDVKIIGNHLLNGYLAGIDVEPNSVNTTGEITIQGNTIRNFGIKPGGLIGAQFYGIDLHSNELDNISVVGNIISAENAQAISCIHGQNVAKFATISGNVLWCNGYADGMDLFAGNGFKNLVISGNIIREFAVYGINGDKNGNVVVDSNILESSQATAGFGIRLSTGSLDPTYATVTGNNVKIVSAVIGAGIFLQGLNGLVVEDNTVTVSSGNGIEVYSNIANMIGAVVSSNFVIDTDVGVNAYFLRGAGAGAIVNCVFGGNAQTGFTTHLATSGGVTFARSINPAGFAMNAANLIWLTGANSPEGVVTADVGSLYTRTNGGAGTTLYIKESGTGNTGWVAK